jgi:hypothetical protein
LLPLQVVAEATALLTAASAMSPGSARLSVLTHTLPSFRSAVAQHPEAARALLSSLMAQVFFFAKPKKRKKKKKRRKKENLE